MLSPGTTETDEKPHRYQPSHAFGVALWVFTNTTVPEYFFHTLWYYYLPTVPEY